MIPMFATTRVITPALPARRRLVAGSVGACATLALLSVLVAAQAHAVVAVGCVLTTCAAGGLAGLALVDRLQRRFDPPTDHARGR